MYKSISNTDISIGREFQENISDQTRAYGFIDHVKDMKQASKPKWTEREFHVQDIKYLQKKPVKLSCDSTQLQILSLFSKQSKTNVVRGFSQKIIICDLTQN